MFFIRIISFFPFFLIYRLGWFLYFLLYYLCGYRRTVVCDNIKQAFPEKSEKEIRCLAKQFYRHFANLFMEVIKAHQMSAEEFKMRCRIKGTEPLIQQSIEKGTGKSRPVIVLTIHQGNWEWMLHGVSQHLGIPVDPVYKPLHHQGWDQFIREVRSRFDSRPIPVKQAGRDILKRRDRFRLFVMLADQAPVGGQRSYWVSYLNKEAPFYLGAEKIACLTQYPVFFAQCRRLERGFYELEFIELATPPYENTQCRNNHPIIDAYVRAAEKAIYEQPETFLWSHRRWKHRRDP